MWIQHANGNIVLVLDEVHIRRLLDLEGGKECADPRIEAIPEAVQPSEPIDIHRTVTKARRPIKKAR